MTGSANRPELLCPAGSIPSLEAALEGGADAVYLGGVSFNARAHAQNFDAGQLREAVRLSHARGVRVYLTLNTLVTDRELPEFLRAAADAARAGVDALIVADVGGAEALRRVMPSMELHASTQMSGHNSAMARELCARGVTRMVAAREISRENLQTLLAESPIETELFVHGALCVCHSGQCLFSSLVGGRSGNRGECAQPCRLPYRGKGTDYPLSLKDLSLAAYVPELCEMGVASFKIEGRMKSPEYVYEVARTFRRLIDGRRGATGEELRRLAGAFSRGGFTDGYYTGHVGRNMLGVRSEEDKEKSRSIAPFGGLTSRVPVAMHVRMLPGVPAELSLSDGRHTVTVTGDIPQAARTAPMGREAVLRQLSKFGATPYSLGKATAEIGEGLMLPVSRLNDLRRRAADALAAANDPPKRPELPYRPRQPQAERLPCRSAVLSRPEQLTQAARDYFDRIFLPLFSFVPGADGVVLPPVIFDGDAGRVRDAAARAKSAGARYALVGNAGHLHFAADAGLIPVGDFRLNVTNAEDVAFWESRGMVQCVLSPELTLPQMRDIGGNTAVIVYGRIPLMILEKCVGKELADCSLCASGRVELVDRRGVRFPVLREWEHRSLIVNSLPTCMSDREDALLRAGLNAWHFLFTVETPREADAVVHAFRTGAPLPGPVRRV
ncbi:MAG: DUF3656 domain-containing protein [Eubacteriales bacterium]|nr:DUF3656 domain-containing protein [Eubacteriales bacterium]